jgi:hypothetical protein
MAERPYCEVVFTVWFGVAKKERSIKNTGLLGVCL